MSISAHLQELRKKHQVLSDRVEEEQRSPSVDPLHLAALKKQKLMLKEQIYRLTPSEGARA